MMSNSNLKQFLSITKDTGKLILLFPASSVAFYAFIHNMTDKIPPNLDYKLATFIMFFSLFIWFYSLVLMNKKSISNTSFCISVVFCFILWFINTILYNRFVYTIPTNKEKIFLGCGFTDNALLLKDKFFITPSDDCPGNFKYILESANYTNTHIWTNKSLYWIQLSFDIIWYLLPISIGAAVSIFIIKCVYTKPHKIPK